MRMRRKRVFVIIQENEPIEKGELFSKLKEEATNLTKNAFSIHLSRLRDENKITTMHDKIITIKKLLEVLL